MPHRPVDYNGGVYNSDVANTANAAVERGTSGEINVGAVNCSAVNNAGGTTLTPAAALAATNTLGTNVTVVKLNAASGAFTTTLPPAAASAGQKYLFIKSDSTGNLPTLKGNGSENINGANTYTGLSTHYATAIFWSDGVEWFGGKLS